MNISDNIKFILNPDVEWSFFTNRRYLAKIQRANPEKEYNVKGQNGVVYNYLEDSYERVLKDGFIITGAAGEMWPIPSSAIKKYDISPDDVTEEPKEVYTLENDTVYAGVRIPFDTEFYLEIDYGHKVILKGNREGIPHGEGDYILVSTRYDGVHFFPDFCGSGRIVNGSIFEILYKPR